MSQYITIGNGMFIHQGVKIGKNVEIGHCSCVGYGDPSDGEIIIEDNVTIGAFCVIHFGAVIRENVIIDHRCVVGVGVEIGTNTQVLSGKEITYKSKIGANCIIAGNVADRTIIEDNVRYLGEIAHSHRNASLDWDQTQEQSPVIRKGSFVGVNALLIGPIQIGPCAYVGASEIVKTNLGYGMSQINGKRQTIKSLRGFVNTYCDE